MRFLLVVALLIAIGLGAAWYFGSGRERARIESAGQEIESAARTAGGTLQDKIRSLNLDGDNIKAELERSGQVIREKSRDAGRKISDATADARITGEIKAKFLREPDLSVLRISVNTTDGIVTLSGSVANEELVGKAMVVALETEGVRQVISTLQIKP